MPSPIDMPRRTSLHAVRPAFAPEIDRSIDEVDSILTHWLDKGMDMEHALWATEITINNIQEII